MIKYYIKKIVLFFLGKPYKVLVKNNILLYPYKFDNLATKNNLSFIHSSDFVRYHSKSLEYGGRDYRFYLRVHQILWCASVSKSLVGDFVELGTGRGYLFAAVCEYLKDNKINKSVYLYDTYIPYKTDKTTGKQENKFKLSEFYAESFEATRNKFSEYDFVTLVQGTCPDSLRGIYEKENRLISLLHIDLNYHEVEIQSLEYLWSNICSGAMIILDDYANPGREKQYEAHEDFFKSKGLMILTTATGQGIIVKS